MYACIMHYNLFYAFSHDSVKSLHLQPLNSHLDVERIMAAKETIEAVNAGADSVMVSNHGGRGPDGVLSATNALQLSQ